MFLCAAPAASANDTTVVENTRAGDPGWSLNPAPAENRWGNTDSASSTIEAYSAWPSVVAGQSLDFFVSTKPVAPYRIEIHRLGWYGGSGGRRVSCLPAGCSTGFPGVSQPAPPAPDATGLVAAGWTRTHSVPVGSTWASGYYLAEFILTGSGHSTSVPFIVRSPTPDPNATLVMAPTNTWQAYNFWGGRSLYVRGSQPAARRVSYDRPYVRRTPALFRYEYQLIRYLEREGRSLEYTTNVDVDNDPAAVRRQPLALSIGHDEYWSMPVRDAFDAARDAGVNLGFFGSNMAYWHVRLENGDRTVVGYKSASSQDPGTPATARFRELGRPECRLLGVQFMGGYTDLGEADRAYTVPAAAVSHRWMSGSGFVAGDTLPKSVGYEWDSTVSGCTPANATTLFEHAGPAEGDSTLGDTRFAHAVAYTAPSGARVFASGSMQFNFTLDDYAGVDTPASAKAQRFVRAMLDELNTGGAPPPPPPPGSDALARDGFGRVVSGGWGLADVGGVWSVVSGPGTAFSVDGGRGSVALPGGQERIVQLGGVAARDVDVTGRFGFGSVSGTSGSGVYVYFLVRRQVDGSYVRLGMYATPAGRLLLRGQDSAGTTLFGDADTGLVFSPGAVYRLRVQLVGASPSTVRLKAWVDGSVEPASWRVSTATSLGPAVAGSVAVRASNTTTTATSVWLDDLEATAAGVTP